MSEELPVLDTVKPIAKCGGCGQNLFLHTAHCRSERKLADCPLFGDRWHQLKQYYSMQNVPSPRS